jgi:hypothetical protein
MHERRLERRWAGTIGTGGLWQVALWGHVQAMLLQRLRNLGQGPEGQLGMDAVST